jgi:hypothetical protein
MTYVPTPPRPQPSQGVILKQVNSKMNDTQIYKGILFVTGDNNCWMNIQNERIEDETIEIECDNLIDKLFDHVPCRIGDNYLYE